MMDTRLTDADISLDQITALNALPALRYTDIRRAIELVNGASARFDRDSTDGDPSGSSRFAVSPRALPFAGGEYDCHRKATAHLITLAGQRDVILTHAELAGHLQLSNYVQALEHTLIGFEQSGTEIDQELEAVSLQPKILYPA